ncbi:MAG: toll/interleukin-1 receptor domain-containing protein [Planctomycetaceae bacterium]|nr:toll/interleukin-1 receptor domain-containing protein [Planctomycetaceae bacterium]
MPRRKTRKPKQLFLSHSHANHAFTVKVAHVLRDHGITVWFAPHQILGADQWQDEIGQALEASDWLAVVLSPDSAKSMWVKREVQYALKEQRFEDRIIPIHFRNHAKIPWAWPLSNFQAIDFRKSFTSAAAKLLQVWGIQLQNNQD